MHSNPRSIGGAEECSTALVGFLQRSFLFSPKAIMRNGFSVSLSRGDNTQGRMRISALILVLLLTFGVACALDRFAWRHNARSRVVDM
jgi:hypothetical protein